MSFSNEELVSEIEGMCEFIDKEDYLKEIYGNTDLVNDGNAILHKKRKLAQIYFHQYMLIKKDELTSQINEIDKEISKYDEAENVKEKVEMLNNEEYEKLNYNFGGIKDILRTLKKLKKEGIVEGEIVITSNLKVKEFPKELRIERLKEKIELIRESQRLDRGLQRYMRKEAKCLVGDAQYEAQIKNIEQEIEKYSG